MLTREMLKNEIDQLQEKHLYILYRAIKALKPKGSSSNKISSATEAKNDEWKQFVSDMYGVLRDEPLYARHLSEISV